MEQLKQPKCPKCKRKMNFAGGNTGSNITTDWACWECDERIVDVQYEVIETKQIKPSYE